MRFVVVGVRPSNPSAVRFREEATKLGHFVDFVVPGQLRIYASPNKFYFKLSGLTYPLDYYDLFYAWSISSKRKQDWFFFLNHIHSTYDISVIYRKYVDPFYHVSFTPTYDYRLQKALGLKFPKSIVFFNKPGAKWAASKMSFPAILKINAPGMTRKGIGVKKIHSVEELLNIVEEYKPVASRFVLREFIPNNGDIRVFIVGYKAIGAMFRKPKQGDFRSNISQGGIGEAFDLTKRPDIKRIAEKIARHLRVEIAGVDIILHSQTKQAYILEVNHGPQFAGLEKYTGVNAVREIVKYWERVRKKEKATRWWRNIRRMVYKFFREKE